MRKILLGLVGVVCALFAVPSWANCNLFDKDTIELGKRLDDSGNITNESNGFVSAKIYVVPNTTYTWQQATTEGVYLRIGEYNSSGFVKLNKGKLLGTQTLTFTTSANTSYVLVSSYNANLDKNQLEQGDTATPYTPYDAECIERCKNLFDKNASYALFDGYIKSADVGQNTTLEAYDGGDKTIIIKVAPNTTYTVTRATNLGSRYDRIRCAAFTTLPVHGSTGVILSNIMDETQANATFTTLSDTQYVAINVKNSGTVGNDWTQFINAFQLEQGSTATEYVPYHPSCHETNIKIASTKYTETVFNPLNTALQSAISVVDSVVSNTITQAASIATLQSGKQTRPADDTCPAGKKCLLVEGTDGKPHWYEIFDPINRWMEGWIAAGKPAPQHTSNSNTLLRWHGNPNFRETYIDGYRDVYVRQWDASPARTVGGMYQTLPAGDIENAGTWAVEYDGTEGDGVNAGVVYGVAKCTTVNQAFATKLTSVNESAFYTLPAPVGQTDNANYPRENFKNCWCKMTAVGVPGADGTAANGAVYPVNSASSAWVFRDLRNSASDCANYCTFYCVDNIRSVPGFRTAVFGLD